VPIDEPVEFHRLTSDLSLDSLTLRGVSESRDVGWKTDEHAGGRKVDTAVPTSSPHRSATVHSTFQSYGLV
jgi:hypothetical protein